MLPLWLEHGGWTLWLLIALSIISTTIAIYKIIQFMWFGVANSKCYTTWQLRIAKANCNDLKSKSRHHNYLLSQVINVGLSQSNELAKQIDFEALMIQFASNKIDQMRGGLKTLEVISITAPLLGLLGTVLGMIEAFEQLKHSTGQVDPSVLSAGISQALLTTAAGLIVALPALCLWHCFERVLDKSQRQIETLLTDIAINTSWQDC